MSAHAKKAQGQRDEPPRPGGQPRIPLASPAAWLVLNALAVFLFRAFQDVGVRRVPCSQFMDVIRQGAFVIGPDWEIVRLWGAKVRRPGTIDGRGHPEAPPENPNLPVAAGEARPAWVLPRALAGTGDDPEGR